MRAVVGSPRRSEALVGALGGEGALQRTITAGLVSLGLLVSSAAFGDDDQVYSREGPYLGFEALLAIENSHDRLDVSETGGLAGRVGFRLTREFACQHQFLNIAARKVFGSDKSLSSTLSTISELVTELSGAEGNHDASTERLIQYYRDHKR